MYKRIVVVFMICFLPMFCGCEANFITSKETNTIEKQYNKKSVGEYQRAYGIEKDDFPFNEAGDDFFSSFKGVDEKLAVEIAFDIIDAYYGEEIVKNNIGGSEIQAYISTVLPERDAYLVSFGPKEGVGMGFYVMIQKSDGAVKGVWAGGE